MMTRKVFQELQLSSASVKGSSKMGANGESIIKNAADGNTSTKSKKVNTVPTKRTRRAKVVNENKPKKASKEVAKKAGSKAKACALEETLSESDLQKTVTLNQSRLESYLHPGTTTRVICDDSAVGDLGNITVSKSISEELQLLTSDSPAQAYWQQLAEQRRIAIEKAVVENEMLVDEINVLQTENMQLKSALEAAESLLKHAGLLD